MNFFHHHFSLTGDGGAVPIYKEPIVWLVGLAAVCYAIAVVVQRWKS